ncbi:MAG: F0F1 ATP synthase subunit delta [Candidatus Omnitrophica bacterium]|nr:F0F1 ATP synthase subunit delta [Candidatus Omnitrophota bacterium]
MVFQLVVVQIVTFIAIVFVLRKLLYSESAKEMLRLRKIKEETAVKQRELQQKIDEAQDAYSEKIAEAEQKTRAFRIKAEEEIEELKKKILSKAKEDAEQIVKSAFNAKEKIREEIGEEMRKKAPLLASRVFKEVLSPEVQEMMHKELVRDVIDKIRNTEKTAFKSKIEKGEIVSAYPLSKNDKLVVESLIHDSLGYQIPLYETEDSQLVAGVLIKLGTILIDGSLNNRLKQVERELEF